MVSTNFRMFSDTSTAPVFRRSLIRSAKSRSNVEPLDSNFWFLQEIKRGKRLNYIKIDIAIKCSPTFVMHRKKGGKLQRIALRYIGDILETFSLRTRAGRSKIKRRDIWFVPCYDLQKTRQMNAKHSDQMSAIGNCTYTHLYRNMRQISSLYNEAPSPLTSERWKSRDNLHVYCLKINMYQTRSPPVWLATWLAKKMR